MCPVRQCVVFNKKTYLLEYSAAILTNKFVI
jgi:hypothetical protein